MKKLLTAVGLLAISTPATLSVVACGTTDIVKPSWDLNAYNDGQMHKIWVEKNDLENLDKLELTKLFWTGMLDSDDKDGDHSRQMERFNNQEVDKHLDIINSDDIIKQIKDSDDELATLNIKDIQVKLDKDLNSKTGKDNPEDYILKASEATWEEITVIFTKNGIEINKLNQIKESFHNFYNEENIVTLKEEPKDGEEVVKIISEDFQEYVRHYPELSGRISISYFDFGTLNREDRKISNVKIRVSVDKNKDKGFALTSFWEGTITYKVN